jgi:hypothetical protein
MCACVVDVDSRNNDYIMNWLMKCGVVKVRCQTRDVNIVSLTPITDHPACDLEQVILL